MDRLLRRGRRAPSNNPPLRIGQRASYGRWRGRVHTCERKNGRWWVGVRGKNTTGGNWSVSTYLYDDQNRTPNFRKVG